MAEHNCYVWLRRHNAASGWVPGRVGAAPTPYPAQPGCLRRGRRAQLVAGDSARRCKQGSGGKFSACPAPNLTAKVQWHQRGLARASLSLPPSAASAAAGLHGFMLNQAGPLLPTAWPLRMPCQWPHSLKCCCHLQSGAQRRQLHSALRGCLGALCGRQLARRMNALATQPWTPGPVLTTSSGPGMSRWG